MKKILLVCILNVFAYTIYAQSVGIGTTTPNANAQLDVSATNKGLLIPRVNLVSLTGDVVTSFGISATPTTSLMVYNTTSSAVFQTGFYFWDGSLWTKLNTGATSSVANAWSLTGNASTSTTNYLGTTDALPLSLRTGGIDRLNITSAGNIGIGTTSPSSKFTVNGDGFLFSNPLTFVGTASSFTSGGVLRTAHTEGSIFTSTTYSLKMDGYRIQAEAQGSLLSSGGPSNLYLNPYGGRVGIGTKILPNAYLEVKGNSIVSRPTLSLTDTIATNYARLQFKNSNSPSYWHIAGLNNATNSTERLNFYNSTSGDVMSITGDGKVGIGTTLPTNPLSFPSSNGKKISLYPGTTGDIGMGVYPYELRHYTDNVVTDMTFGVDDFTTGFTENMRIKGNGNVGIGTANPGVKLSVVTASDAYGISHNNGAIQLATYLSSGTDIGGQIGTVSNHPLRFFTNNAATAQATLLQNGNFGIGILTPTSPLSFPANGGKKISLYPGTTGDIGMGVYPFELRHFTDNIVTDITFGVDNFSTGFTERMRIKGNGDVFIGTNNLTSGAGYKLRVGGKIFSEEVRVQLQSAWPDYVFDKKYKKLSITELEEFVTKNNHLPNIPSAADIEKDGQHLGEIQRKMLEKIEELSLYIIEQNKRIELLESKFKLNK